MGKIKEFYLSKSLPVKIGMIIVGLAGGGVFLYFAVKMLILFGAIMLLFFDSVLSRTETYTDVQNYTTYIGENAKDKFASKWNMDESIFPKEITDEMQVDDFSMTYYNPWDAEYVGYLTVTYSPEDYKDELDRLSEKTKDSYIGNFNVTGEPEGYSLLAIDSDSYYGFVYAIDSETKENTITYVEVSFPGKLEMKLNKYLPEEYQLKDMDVSKRQ